MSTPRERFIHALERRPPLPGRVPHFELVFFLTMEAFGKVHPSQRNYYQWEQMTEKERRLHREDMADLYMATAERFGHDAILVHTAAGCDAYAEILRVAEAIRRKSGDRYFLMAHGDCTYSMPSGGDMVEFSSRMYEEPEAVEAEARRRLDEQVARMKRYKGVLDGFALCADYAMNNAPFFSPEMFGRFIAPYLGELIAAYRTEGFYAIKHTDGCIWPILDQIADARPHALHSIDPQGSMDLARVKREYGDRMCLIGNVNCAALDTGTDEEAVASAREALAAGMPGGGYIFSTSNCVYTGMRLERYELMLDVWRKEGTYPG